MELIGTGILNWDGHERRSRRYGSVTIGSTGYTPDVAYASSLDQGWLEQYAGEQVRLVAVVIEARASEHAGDAFLGLMPQRPTVGEQIEIGVGKLALFPIQWGEHPVAVALKPSDGREELWLDPRILYRLHDQTVELYAEVTTLPDSPAPDLSFRPDGVISNGDGSMQVSGGAYKTAPGLALLPNIVDLGEGAFTFGATVEPGAGEYVENAVPLRPMRKIRRSYKLVIHNGVVSYDDDI